MAKLGAFCRFYLLWYIRRFKLFEILSRENLRYVSKMIDFVNYLCPISLHYTHFLTEIWFWSFALFFYTVYIFSSKKTICGNNITVLYYKIFTSNKCFCTYLMQTILMPVLKFLFHCILSTSQYCILSASQYCILSASQYCILLD